MERQRRQKEAEQKTIEEQAAKRIEMLVKKRVEEELEKRRDEIEQEVNRRVDTAKAEMERDMMLELEKRREQIREEERRREVGARIQISLDDCCYHKYPNYQLPHAQYTAFDYNYRKTHTCTKPIAVANSRLEKTLLRICVATFPVTNCNYQVLKAQFASSVCVYVCVLACVYQKLTNTHL